MIEAIVSRVPLLAQSERRSRQFSTVVNRRLHVLTCRLKISLAYQNQKGSKARLSRRMLPQPTRRQSKKCPTVNHVRK